MDKLNRKHLTILPLSERQHKMTVADVYPLDADPPLYENPRLRAVADRIVEAHRSGKQVIWMMGAHVNAARQLAFYHQFDGTRCHHTRCYQWCLRHPRL